MEAKDLEAVIHEMVERVRASRGMKHEIKSLVTRLRERCEHAEIERGRLDARVQALKDAINGLWR